MVKRLNKKKRFWIVIIVLLILTIASFCVNVLAGSSGLTPMEAANAVFGKGSGAAVNIIQKIRLPRAISAIFLGGALALSGYLMQMFFRNPIAGPFVLGVSSGSKLAVALLMIGAAALKTALSSAVTIGAAFIGAMAALGLVLLISRKVRGMAMLVVCGVMIGYVCSAVTDFIVNFAADSDIVNLHNWSMGSFSGMTMDNVAVILAVTIPAAFGTYLLSKPLGAYSMGEDYARTLGVNVKRLRLTLILLSGLMAAAVTAFAGPVSFVGIAVPHIIRRVLHTTKPAYLVSACFLGGSIFCSVCDLLARTVLAPTELSISTVTAIFGAPVVIWMMIRGRRGEV